ncbi:hypothetical protein N7467_012032 [Penicillium canescens]|nr:hypothetical protein N7467_012032 [Penicillium canescens]
MTNMFGNSFDPRFNILAPLMACLGFSKTETACFPTELPHSFRVEETEPTPEKMHTGTLCDRSFCKEPGIQGQLGGQSDISLHRGGVSTRREKAKRLAGGHRASPHEEVNNAEADKVIDVLSIHYETCKLSTARVRVTVEYGGEKETKWLDYEKIRKIDGTGEAMKRFMPTWKEGGQLQTARSSEPQ